MKDLILNLAENPALLISILALLLFIISKFNVFEQILKIKKLITSENMFANTYYTSNWKYKNQCFNPEMVKKYLKGIYNA